MSTSLRAAALLLSIAGVLGLASCTSGGGADPTPSTRTSAPSSPARAGAPSTPSTTGPSTSAKGSSGGKITRATCEVTRTNAEIFVRDWGRVVGAVGRPDQATYSEAFVKLVDNLARKGAHCAAPSKIKALAKMAVTINNNAKKGHPDYSAFRRFADKGNAWLAALGYEDLELSDG